MLLQRTGQLTEAALKPLQLVLIEGTFLWSKCPQSGVGRAQDRVNGGTVVLYFLLQELRGERCYIIK